MSADPAPVRFAGEVLPESVKEHLRPIYQRATARVAASVDGSYKFTYNGSEYRFEPTKETAWMFKDAVVDGVLTDEHVPIDVLDNASAYDRAIDIGAHHGLYTVLLRLLNPELRIVAFEPERRNRQVCREVLLANDVDASVRREVVIDESGVVEFHVAPEDGSEGHTVTPTDGYSAVSKPAVALSDELNSDESAWVKIDVEGAEWSVLNDLFEAETEVAGLVELHPEKLPVPTDDVIALLEEECSTVECLGETVPNHTATASIDHEHNRPMYHFTQI